jgi:hypothetical protein
MPKRLTAMHVGDVHLDHSSTRSGDRVLERDAGMGVRGRVQYYADRLAGRLSLTGLLDPIDQLTLPVGLAKFQRPAQFIRDLQTGPLDIGQGRLAIDLWLAHPQQAEVRAIQDVRGGHGGTPSWPR